MGIGKGKTDYLLSLIREGKQMTLGQQLRLTAYLSVPAIMAQISSIAMQYIDASMVGSLGANAAASIGLVSTTTWLFWGVCAAAATGFSVQVAHRIGAGDFVEAKKILRQAVTATLVFSSLLAVGGICISGMLPLWLGGDEAIWNDSSLYFRIFALFLPALQLNFLAGGMLRCSGNMRVPAMLNIMMCLLDVVFNFFLIFPTRHVEWFGVVFTAPGAGLGVKGAILGTVLAELVTAGGMMWYLCRRSPMLSSSENGEVFYPNGRHCVSLSVFRYRWDSNTWPFVERRSQRRWLSHRSASLPLLPTRSPLLPKAFAICPATVSRKLPRHWSDKASGQTASGCSVVLPILPSGRGC